LSGKLKLRSAFTDYITQRCAKSIKINNKDISTNRARQKMMLRPYSRSGSPAAARLWTKSLLHILPKPEASERMQSKAFLFRTIKSIPNMRGITHKKHAGRFSGKDLNDRYTAVGDLETPET